MAEPEPVASCCNGWSRLDVLVLTREPIVPGALIKVRAIGVLSMIDGGEKDDKVVAVPASDIDPHYDEIKTIDNLPAIERQRIEAFFSVYKQLPEGRKTVELNGFSGANVAIDIPPIVPSPSIGNASRLSPRPAATARGLMTDHIEAITARALLNATPEKDFPDLLTAYAREKGL